MDYLLYFLVFCIGATFGSFFTLAVYRIPIKQDITHTRSYCPKCAHKLLSGLAFVLFAASIKFSVFSMNYQTVTYFGFGLLYLATLFIIAGIDKEGIKIEKPVLLFGFICVTLYMIYLYIVENDASIYRYVIYLVLACLLLLFSIIYLKKKAKDSYAIDILILSMLMVLFTYETVYIYTVITTLLAVSIQLLIKKFCNKKSKILRKVKVENSKIPVGFYMCSANIIILIMTNFVLFYR